MQYCVTMVYLSFNMDALAEFIHGRSLGGHGILRNLNKKVNWHLFKYV